MSKYLTVKDLTEIFQVSSMTIHRWKKEGLPFIKLGHSLRFEETAVKEWIETHKKG